MARLYLGNISFRLNENDLEDELNAIGIEASNVEIMYDRDTRRSRGFAFCDVPTDEDARIAIEQITGTPVAGRPIKIAPAHPVQPKEAMAEGEAPRSPPRQIKYPSPEPLIRRRGPAERPSKRTKRSDDIWDE
jgi:RNA recognition motif-containing protein